MARTDQDARSEGDGKYVRTLESAKRDAEAARLRSRGYTYQHIADEMGLHGKQAAFDCVKRALKAVVQEAATEVIALELDRLDSELARLNDLEAAARVVMERAHITVNNGHVIKVDGEHLIDDAPVLQAIDRLVKIEDSRRRNGESRRKLLGIDAPTRMDTTVQEVKAEDIELTGIILRRRARNAALEEQINREGQ